MKRDWEVIRKVLCDIEESGFEPIGYRAPINSFDTEAIEGRHALLLWGAGFISGVQASDSQGEELLNPQLTWQGHDLLDTIRSKPVWEQIKATAQAKGVELTFDSVKAFGKAAWASLSSDMTGAG
nr:DUF2513 domain-containing protein [uncultured Halomonas sp.]